MRLWIAASATFFAYVVACAALVSGLAPRRRARVVTLSGAGLVLCAGGHLLPHEPLLHQWILPPVLLLLGYWTSGLLFVAPMPAAERLLEAIDRAVGVDHVAAVMPRWSAELMEAAYLSIYPLIGLGFAAHLLGSTAPDSDRFWNVILITDFICFACLPWVQTRPPRALLNGGPWRARLRRLNLWLLGRVSIKVNTFPSGHAAEACVLALLLADLSWPLAGGMAVAAVLVSAGAALGRYHYAADVLAGWSVALAVWLTLG